MAIAYINSGDTNNTGRLQINANADELITGTTLSSNVGEYILDQFGGGTITGNIPLPNAQTNPSRLVQLGASGYTAGTIYITGGEYELGGNSITISNLSSVSLNSNITSLDRYDSIYLGDNGALHVNQGTPGVEPQIPDFSSGSTEWAYIGSVRVLASQGGFFICEPYTWAPNDIGTGEPEYYGGLNPTLGGGWVPKTQTGTQVISAIDNSFAFGRGNKVFSSFSSIFGGARNTIDTSTSGSTILNGQDNKVTGNHKSLIQGNGFTLSSSNTHEHSVSVPHLHVFSGISVNTATPDADYSVQVGDYHVGVQSLSGAVTVTLPNAASVMDGQMYIVKDAQGNAHLNNITITGDTSIDSTTFAIISSRWESISFIYNSTLNTWLIT